MRTVGFILAWLLVALWQPARAGVSTNLLTTTLVNGTTGGNVALWSGVVFPLQTFNIQSLGITNSPAATNAGGLYTAFTANEQVSLDGVNWTTVATYNPPTTNANWDTWTPVLGSQTVYMRVQIVSTNSVGVGVFAR